MVLFCCCKMLQALTFWKARRSHDHAKSWYWYCCILKIQSTLPAQTSHCMIGTAAWRSPLDRRLLLSYPCLVGYAGLATSKWSARAASDRLPLGQGLKEREREKSGSVRDVPLPSSTRQTRSSTLESSWKENSIGKKCKCTRVLSAYTVFWPCMNS